MKFIREPDPRWAGRFEAIRAHLAQHLPAECRIHHVGSTSIPGLPSKDVIDVTIECPRGAMRPVIDALAPAGYRHAGDKGLEGREAFELIDAELSVALDRHHLYACEEGATELTKHLAFRDYLREDVAARQRIAHAKRRADEQAHTKAEYIALKAPTYAQVALEAVRWHWQRETERARGDAPAG